MAIQPPKPLDVGELIGSSNEDVYTTPTATRTIITAATAHNTTGSSATLTVWIGTSATDATERFNQGIAGEDTVDLVGILGQALQAGEKIIAVSGTADVISVRLSGTEYAVT